MSGGITMQYPATFTRTDKHIVVSFRDIPEAHTQGSTDKQAVEMAEDALITAMSFYFEDNRNIPLPSKQQDGEVMIDLPICAATKILLLNTMLDLRVNQADLARLMKVSPQNITRIVDIHHATKINTMEKAFNAMDMELTINVSQRRLVFT